MKLTEHFSLEEFTRSSTAIKYGLKNEPNAQQIANMKALCEHCLEPLRDFANSPEGRPSHSLSPSQETPIIISSGFRCPAVNSNPEVRGANNSNHLTGCAADIHIPSTEVGREWFRWMMDNLEFDELIWETADRIHYWIHIAYRPTGNRQKVISFLQKK